MLVRIAWDGTSEADAGQLCEKVEALIKNLAKARPGITNSWADLSEEWDGGWGDAEETTGKDEDHDDNHEEANIQFLGKGDGQSKGKERFPRQLLRVRRVRAFAVGMPQGQR